MIRSQFADAVLQWRQNRRLRVAVLVGLLVLGFHLAFTLADRRDLLVASYQRDQQLLTRLESASREEEWPARAEQLRDTLQAAQAEVPRVPSAGLAQAELQAWLTEQANVAGLVQARVRTETTIEVPSRPELWQVIARLDAQAGKAGLQGFLRSMAEALPWVQVEQLDVREGQQGIQVTLIARAYYQRPAEGEAEQ